MSDERKTGFHVVEREGMATAGAAVEELVEWLKDELAGMRYGEVGLTFTVHGGRITKHRKVLEVSEKI
jgi:hypothetical protein